MNSRFQKIMGFAFIFDVIIMDQLSKWGVLEYIIRPKALPDTPSLNLIEWFAASPERLPVGAVETPLPFFNWAMVWNEGVSFGMTPTDSPALLIAVALLIVGVFGFWLTRAHTLGQALAIGGVIGGALGNVIDRFRFGAVADFLDFYAYGWHYPAFNVADSAITLGIVFLIFDGIVLEPKRKKASL
jgi:signal peptidase II